MRRKLNRSQSDHEAPISAGRGASTVTSLAVSGQYIALAKKGMLDKFSRLHTELQKLQTELANIEGALTECNQPSWLNKFAAQVRRQGKNFKTVLEAQVERLESQKSRKEARIEKIRAQIKKIGPFIPEVPVTSLAISPVGAYFSQASRVSNRGRGTNPAAQFRDSVIQKYGASGDKQICNNIDVDLPKQGELPLGFPKAWMEKYGCKTFSSAYEDSRCRKLVQKMISKAKAAS